MRVLAPHAFTLTNPGVCISKTSLCVQSKCLQVYWQQVHMSFDFVDVFSGEEGEKTRNVGPHARQPHAGPPPRWTAHHADDFGLGAGGASLGFFSGRGWRSFAAIFLLESGVQNHNPPPALTKPVACMQNAVWQPSRKGQGSPISPHETDFASDLSHARLGEAHGDVTFRRTPMCLRRHAATNHGWPLFGDRGHGRGRAARGTVLAKILGEVVGHQDWKDQNWAVP